MNISDFTLLNGPGQRFLGLAIVLESSIGTASNGKPFMNIKLGKKNVSLTGKLWEAGFMNHNSTEIQQVFAPGRVLWISATTSIFRDSLQLTIEAFKVPTEDEYVLEDFLDSAPESAHHLETELKIFMSEIKTSLLQYITSGIFTDHKREFLSYPAAKSNHHAFLSGLLYHTVSMLRIAKNLCDQYKEINREMIYAGIILHDAGKVIEYTKAIAPDYSYEGNMLGHIQIGNLFIWQKFNEYQSDFYEEELEVQEANRELVVELMHVVSAHHGKKEWGSPVEAHTLEAEIIHHIDMIDSRINMIVNGLEGKPEGVFHKIPPLGNYYK